MEISIYKEHFSLDSILLASSLLHWKQVPTSLKDSSFEFYGKIHY